MKLSEFIIKLQEKQRELETDPTVTFEDAEFGFIEGTDILVYDKDTLVITDLRDSF